MKRTAWFVGSLQQLREAVKHITQDSGFKVPSVLASNALSDAQQLLKWMEEDVNKAKASMFATSLVESLEVCFNAELDAVCRFNMSVSVRIFLS